MFVIVHLQHYVYCILYACAIRKFTVYLRAIFHNHSSDSLLVMATKPRQEGNYLRQPFYYSTL